MTRPVAGAGRAVWSAGPAAPRIACAVGLWLIAVLPILVVAVPPLLDYPNHLARMAVLAGSPPNLARFYQAHWRPLPNLAMDGVVPLLARFIPLELAGRVFLLAIMALLAGGTVALHRTLSGRWSWWPWLSLLLIWDHVFLMGFLNYLCSTGLAFCGLAAWVGLGPARPVWRLCVGFVFAFATYFAHLFGFGLYALGIVGIEIGAALQSRAGSLGGPGRAWLPLAGLATAALTLLGPSLLFVGFAGGGAGSGHVGFGKLLRRLDPFFSPYDDYDRPFDFVCFGLFLLGLAFLWGTGRVRLDPRMRWPLGLFLAAHLLMPTALLTAEGAERRMPLAIFLLLLAALQSTQRFSPGWRRVVMLAGVLMLCARSAVATSGWLAADRLERPRLEALDRLGPGSRLAVAYTPDALQMAPGTFPVAHLAAYATVRRGVFVQTLFAQATQQPLELRPEFAELAAATPPDALWAALVLGRPDAGTLAALRHYDAVLLVSHRDFAVAPAVGATLTPLYADPGFQLFRVAGRE